jgi:hypothetical protein
MKRVSVSSTAAILGPWCRPQDFESGHQADLLFAPLRIAQLQHHSSNDITANQAGSGSANSVRNLPGRFPEKGWDNSARTLRVPSRCLLF